MRDMAPHLENYAFRIVNSPSTSMAVTCNMHSQAEQDLILNGERHFIRFVRQNRYSVDFHRYFVIASSGKSHDVPHRELIWIPR